MTARPSLVEFDSVLNDRVRADDQVDLAGCEIFVDLSFFGGFGAADKQFDAIAGVVE